MRNFNDTHIYWKRYAEDPRNYLSFMERSVFFFRYFKKYAIPTDRILEIGCGAGRNLSYLFNQGFKNLSGVEICQAAISCFRQAYPDVYTYTTIWEHPIEECIKWFMEGEFDIVFTMALLQHIHSDADWIFKKIVNITRKYLIIIEDEHRESKVHCPRKYKDIFESLGMKQVEETTGIQLINEVMDPPTTRYVFGYDYYLRVFKK